MIYRYKRIIEDEMIDNTLNMKFLKASETQGLNEITTDNIIKDIKNLIE